MEFPLRHRYQPFIWSDSWRQILQNNGDAIPDTLRRSIHGIEGACNRFLNFFVPGCGTLKVKLVRKYEDFGNEVLSSKDTPDWKNVEENLQRMYNEHKSAEREGKGRLAHDDGEPKRKIQIKVKTVKGLEHVFKGMFTRDLILDFKRKIASQIGGMVEDEIILLYGDKELCDNDTLDTYGITNGETVFMLQRLRRKGLMETARYLYNEARNVLKHLGEWVPGLFADSTRALTIKELSKVAQEIGMNWELLGPALGLDSVQMDHITEDNPSSTVKKIYTMLTIWLNENQGEATVGKLYQAMNDCKKVRFNWTKIKNIFSDVDAVFISG